MATRRNIEVVITVRDAATKSLENVERKLKDVSNATKVASIDFTQFNRTLFSTTAFVGTFLKAFSSIKNSLEIGGDLDRLSNQYERVLGPKGQLFQSISSLTTTSISRMEAMRAGLQLSSLGITKDVGQAADIIAKAGTAAKLAGLDSSEGIQKFTEFLKSGNISSLEFLNLISRANPALQAQLALLNKAGGTMGTVVSTQAKLTIGMALLNAATKGQMNQMRDLKDIVLSFGDSWDWLRRQIGRFIGAALGPLIDKLSIFIFNISDSIDKIRQKEKSLVFLAKVIMLTTGSLIGLAGALGSVRLMVKLLGFAGIGLPGLSTALLVLTGLFIGLTNSTDSVLNRLKIFGAFVHGIWQLVTNLDPETGFAKIDKSIHKLLKEAGLLTLAKNIARIGSIIKTVVEDSIDAFKNLSKWLDNSFGGIFKTIIGFLDNFDEAWNNWWISKSISPIQKFIRAAGVIIVSFFTFLAGKKVFGLLQGILSKIPIIGKIFGGGSGGLGGGPKGTPTDPIYVAQSGIGGAVGSIASGALSLLFPKAIKDFISLLIQSFKLGGLKQLIKDIPTAITLAFPKLASIIISAASTFGSIMATVGGPLLAAAIGTAIGFLINSALDKTTKGKTSEGFEGNIVERIFFKLFADQTTKQRFKDIEEFTNKSKLDLINEYRAKQGKAPLSELPIHMQDRKTEVVIPKMPDSQLEIVDALGEQMKSLEDEKLTKFKGSVEAALATGSLGGGQITADEYRDAMLMALDNSTNLSILADKAKESKLTITPSSRR